MINFFRRDDVILWSNEEQNDKVGSLRMDVTENAVVFTHEKPKTLDKSASKESVKESVKELKKESSSSSKSDSLSRSSSRRKREEAEASTTITKSSSRDRKEKSEKKEKKERRSSSRSDLTESKAETPRYLIIQSCDPYVLPGKLWIFSRLWKKIQNLK